MHKKTQSSLSSFTALCFSLFLFSVVVRGLGTDFDFHPPQRQLLQAAGESKSLSGSSERFCSLNNATGECDLQKYGTNDVEKDENF
jgi:hypothetical protein